MSKFKHINKNYVDSFSNTLITDNDVLLCDYYDLRGDSWEKCIEDASWYREVASVNDSFSGAYNSSIWSEVNIKGTAGIGSAEGLVLDIYKGEGRGGLTSENKWRLLGDFSVTCVVDRQSISGSFRSRCAIGCTVFVDSSHMARLSLYYNGSDVVVAAHVANDMDYRYFGWQLVGERFIPSGADGIGLTINRSGGETISFVCNHGGTTLNVGSVEIQGWDDHVYCGLEIETEQQNTFSGEIRGFYVDEGDVDAYGTIIQRDSRGGSSCFPDQVMVAVDAVSLSIIDYTNMTLWMRFFYGDGRLFDKPSSVSFAGGSLIAASKAGVSIVDFAEDSCYLINENRILKAIGGIERRNSKLVWATYSTNYSLPSEEANDVDSTCYNGQVYYAMATVNGVVVLDKSLQHKVSYSPNPFVKQVKFADSGNLYWVSVEDPGNIHKIAWRQGLLPAWDAVPSIFFDTENLHRDGGALRLSSSYATCFDVVAGDHGDVLAIGNLNGFDVVRYPWYIKRYGVSVSVDVAFEDPTFETAPGVVWEIGRQGFVPRVHVVRSTGWSSVGSGSFKFYVEESGASAGEYVEVYTYIDLTTVSAILFDFMFFLKSGYASSVTEHLQVVVGKEIVFSSQCRSHDRYAANEVQVHQDNIADVSSFFGNQKVSFRLSSVSGELTRLARKYYYLDNLRIRQHQADSDISVWKGERIPLYIQDIDLVVGDNFNKVFWSNEAGYGIVDFDSDVLENYVRSGAILSDSKVNSVSFLGRG